MPEAEDNPVHRSARRKSAFRTRCRRYGLLLLLAWLIPFGGYRGWLAWQQARIRHLGGTTTTGVPALYADLAYHYRSPSVVRSLVGTDVVGWLFGQFPVVYIVDLRGINSPRKIDEALQVASGFNELTHLVFYQSAVQDHHLKMVRDFFPHLVSLKINDTDITDIGIQHLAGMSDLCHINLQQTQITDASISVFLSLPRLIELNIADTQLTSVERLDDVYAVTTRLVTRQHTTDQQRRGW